MHKFITSVLRLSPNPPGQSKDPPTIRSDLTDAQLHNRHQMHMHPVTSAVSNGLILEIYKPRTHRNHWTSHFPTLTELPTRPSSFTCGNADRHTTIRTAMPIAMARPISTDMNSTPKKDANQTRQSSLSTCACGAGSSGTLWCGMVWYGRCGSGVVRMGWKCCGEV